jgi:hypothetical protein
MMDCSQFRSALLSDPRDTSAELAAHRASCHDCAQFAEQLMRFEARLERALRVDTADEPVRHMRWLAIAASVLIAVVVAGSLWLAVPGPSLAADVVTHMAGEPEAWQTTDVPVPGSDLSAVLNDSHLRLKPDVGVVSYAQSCQFRGHHVPHLVVQTASGPVTVMVLVHEPVRTTTQFDEGGYRGVIVPMAGHGSLAVLTRGESTDPKTVEQVAARVENSIIWN